MDKYQEALKKVEKSCISDAMEFNYGKLLEEVEKALSLLQELVNKATPKKPYFLNYGGYKIGNWKCPSCDLIITKDNYCKCCGQALDWSEFRYVRKR